MGVLWENIQWILSLYRAPIIYSSNASVVQSPWVYILILAKEIVFPEMLIKK